MSKTYKQPGFLAAFFGFKRMVSPVFIRLFYYLGMIGILTGAGAAFMQKGPMAEHILHSGLSIGGAVGYYVAIVLAALALTLIWRFCCELLIVLFSIFNRLDEISSALNHAAEAADAAPSTIAAVPVSTPEPAAAEDNQGKAPPNEAAAEGADKPSADTSKNSTNGEKEDAASDDEKTD